MNNPQYRAPGHEHIPIYPRGFIAIRIIQLVLSILILALAAYSVALLAYDANSFILAVALMTFITSIYHLVARFNAPAIYNYWATLGLDIFFIVMWLASFALLASRVAAYFSYVDYYSSYSSYYSSYYGSYGLSTGDLVWLACQAAAASLGGLQFVLYIIALVIHSIRVHRHRAAGLHCMPGVPPTPPTGGPAPIQVPYGTAPPPQQGGEKPPGTGPIYQPYPPQPQPPVPAYHPHPGQPLQQQQQSYPMQPYPQQQQVPVPVPMPVPSPDAHQHYQQQQQQQQQPPQQGYYQPPPPSQSPAPPSTAGGEYGHPQGQGQGQVPGQGGY